MPELMTVTQAFAKATDLQSIAEDNVDIVETQIAGRKKAAIKTTAEVSTELATWALGGRKPKVELDRRSNLTSTWRFLGSGPLQDEMKRRGGYWKLAAHLWKGAETARDVASGGHPVVLAYKIGTLISDAAVDAHKEILKNQTKELAAQVDFVCQAWSRVEQDLIRTADAITKESQAACDKAARKWLSGDKRTFEGRLIGSLINRGTSGRADAGRDFVQSMVKGALKHDLAYIYGLAASLYCVGLAADSFVVACQAASRNPTNEALGFPEYKGFVMKERSDILKLFVQSGARLSTDAKYQIEGLDNFHDNLWTFLSGMLAIE